MTCDNCVHYWLCHHNTYEQAKYFGKDKEIYITIKNNSACLFFKDKSRYIELPCKVGDTVYSIVEGINRIFIGEVYEYVVGREHFVFRSTRKGYLTLAFTELDIGKTVFLTKDEAEKALTECEGK